MVPRDTSRAGAVGETTRGTRARATATASSRPIATTTSVFVSPGRYRNLSIERFALLPGNLLDGDDRAGAEATEAARQAAAEEKERLAAEKAAADSAASGGASSAPAQS